MNFNEVNFKKESEFLKSAIISFSEDMKVQGTSPKDIINILAKYGLIVEFNNRVTSLRLFRIEKW